MLFFDVLVVLAYHTFDNWWLYRMKTVHTCTIQN